MNLARFSDCCVLRILLDKEVAVVPELVKPPLQSTRFGRPIPDRSAEHRRSATYRFGIARAVADFQR